MPSTYFYFQPKCDSNANNKTKARKKAELRSDLWLEFGKFMWEHKRDNLRENK